MLCSGGCDDHTACTWLSRLYDDSIIPRQDGDIADIHGSGAVSVDACVHRSTLR